jgi:hypothetical protein
MEYNFPLLEDFILLLFYRELRQRSSQVFVDTTKSQTQSIGKTQKYFPFYLFFALEVKLEIKRSLGSGTFAKILDRHSWTRKRTKRFLEYASFCLNSNLKKFKVLKYLY